MAEPSASRQSTGRSGQATAAPVAAGRPQPIAPPLRNSQSWGGAPAVAARTGSEPVIASSTTIDPSGSAAATAAANAATVSGPSGGGAGGSGSGVRAPRAP